MHISHVAYQIMLLVRLLLSVVCVGAALMAGRPAKLARLQALRSKLPYISQSALAAVLAEAEREPLPKVASRQVIRSARDELVRSVTPYGALHQIVKLDLDSGGQFDCEVQHPFALFHYLCSTSDAFAEFIKGVAAAHAGHHLHG